MLAGGTLIAYQALAVALRRRVLRCTRPGLERRMAVIAVALTRGGMMALGVLLVVGGVVGWGG